MTVQKLLPLLQCKKPATTKEIRLLGRAVDVILPTDYIQFLRATNGGTGMVGGSYVVFSSTTEVMNAREIDLDFGSSGRYLTFATDGANTKFAFDTTASPTNQVVKLDKIDDDLVSTVAGNFSEFLDQLSKQIAKDTEVRYSKTEVSDFLKRSIQFQRRRKKES